MQSTDDNPSEASAISFLPDPCPQRRRQTERLSQSRKAAGEKAAQEDARGISAAAGCRVCRVWCVAFGRSVLGGQTPAPAADSGIVGRVLVVRRRSRDGTDGTSGL